MSDMPDWVKAAQLVAPGDLGTLSVANGQSAIGGTFTLSPLATGVLVIPFTTNPSVKKVQIAGGVSGTNYANVTQSSIVWPNLYVNITGVSENPVVVSITLQAVQNTGNPLPVCHVYQLFGAAVTQVGNSLLTPLYVSQVPAPTNNPTGNQLQTLRVNAAPAASGTGTLIGNGLNQIVTIYGYDLTMVPTVTPAGVGLYEVIYEDASAAVIVVDQEIRVSTGVGSIVLRHALDIPKGIQLPSSQGLKYVAGSTNVGNVDIKGLIYYTQLPAN